MVNKLAIMNVYSRQPDCECRFALLTIDAAVAATLRERVRSVRKEKFHDSLVTEMSWSDKQLILVKDLPSAVTAEMRSQLSMSESIIIEDPTLMLSAIPTAWCHMVADFDSVYWRALSKSVEVEMWTGFIFLKELQEL